MLLTSLLGVHHTVTVVVKGTFQFKGPIPRTATPVSSTHTFDHSSMVATLNHNDLVSLVTTPNTYTFHP